MSAAMPKNVGEIIELVAPGGALHKPFGISELLCKVGTILDLERSRTGDAADPGLNSVESKSRRERKTIEEASRSRLTNLACEILTHESDIGLPCDMTAMQMLTGENGFRSFLGRALMLSRPEVVWFGAVNISSKGFIEGLRRAESKLTPIEIILGETVLVAPTSLVCCSPLSAIK
jgi:hypothetical protein